MKTVSAKATLSKDAKSLLEKRETARDLMRSVIESQARSVSAECAGGPLRSKNGKFIFFTERPASKGLKIAPKV